jgi:hypothetical protein
VLSIGSLIAKQDSVATEKAPLFSQSVMKARAS